MTLCSYARGQNLGAALVTFLDVLGDKRFSAFSISSSDYLTVLSTTWAELADQGWREEIFINSEMYEVLLSGYVKASRC
jgi:hypothetical protein